MGKNININEEIVWLIWEVAFGEEERNEWEKTLNSAETEEDKKCAAEEAIFRMRELLLERGLQGKELDERYPLTRECEKLKLTSYSDDGIEYVCEDGKYRIIQWFGEENKTETGQRKMPYYYKNELDHFFTHVLNKYATTGILRGQIQETGLLCLVLDSLREKNGKTSLTDLKRELNNWLMEEIRKEEEILSNV